MAALRLTMPPSLVKRQLTIGWPMALAVGNANSAAEFVFPTSEEMGHPMNDDPSNQPLTGYYRAR